MSEHEHPVEIARRALLEARDLESDLQWKALFEKFASCLPDRRAVPSVPDREAQREQEREWHEEWRAQQWKYLPMHVREREVLEAVGDNRLITREIVERIAAGTDMNVTSPGVNGILVRLVWGRELDREAEVWKNRKRYRYFRPGRLEGPIADLDKQFGA